MLSSTYTLLSHNLVEFWFALYTEHRTILYTGYNQLVAVVCYCVFYKHEISHYNAHRLTFCFSAVELYRICDVRPNQVKPDST